MNINDVTHAIMFGNYTNEQLNAIAMAITYRRNQLGQATKRSLSLHSNVKFVSSRDNRTVLGTVTKINRKTVLVREDRGNYAPLNWRVPANMLEVV
jgi:hypothetical protein